MFNARIVLISGCVFYSISRGDGDWVSLFYAPHKLKHQNNIAFEYYSHQTDKNYSHAAAAALSKVYGNLECDSKTAKK